MRRLPSRLGGGATLLTQSTAQPSLTLAFKQGNGANAYGIGVQEEKSPTLAHADSGTNLVPAVALINE